MIRRGLSAIGLGALLLAATPASATTFDYMTAPGVVLRSDDAASVSIRPSRGGAWRTIFHVAGAGEAIAGLSCDRVSASVCFVEVAFRVDRRAEWRPVELSGSGASSWSTLHDVDASIADVDDTAGLALVIVERARDPRPSDPPPGVYLWARGRNFDEARRLTELAPQCLNAARFVRAVEPPLVFISKGCGASGQPAAWIVMTADGGALSSFRPVGLPIAVDGGDLLFLSRLPATAPDQTVYRFRMPTGPPGKWVGGAVYQPGPAGARPAIMHTGPEAFPPSMAVLAGGVAVAVENPAGGPRLFTFCVHPNGGDAATLSPAQIAELGDVGQLRVASQGGDAAIVSAWDRWGERRQFLLRADRCGVSNLALEPLPPADPPAAPRPPLPTTFRSVKADDDETLPYAVLGSRAVRGPLLVEAYGASDQPTVAMAQVSLERLWIERGGRVAIATVRGDAREPPWTVNPSGDYKTRAANDLIEIVENLIARGETSPGAVTALGASAGAFTVARAVLLRPDLFSAAVLVAGPFDLRYGPGAIGPASGDFPQWFAGSQRSDGACRTVQLFIYQGGQDDRVAPENAVEFAKYLASLGYHGQVFVNPAAGHFLLEDPSSGPAILANLDKWAAERTACPGAPAS